MKVAYIVSMKRGLPVFTYRKVKLLREKYGLDVHLYVMRDGKGVAMPEPEWPIVKISFLKVPYRHLLTFIKTPKKYIQSFVESILEGTLVHFAMAVYYLIDMKRSNIELIYCFEGTHALWISYFIHKWQPLPVIVNVHAEMITHKKHESITLKASKICSKITTDSNFNKERLIDKFNLKEDLVEVVRLWSPYEVDNRIKVLIVGEWSERKAHEVLLDAFEELDPEMYLLWVVGGGTWSGEYYDVEEEIKKRGLDNVILWGRVPEEFLKVLYQSADIFTLPSRTTSKGITEGIPVSLMEAMSYGCPVISTYHVGIPELVEDILIEENNPDQLKEAIKKLGEDKQLRERLGKRNIEIISESYSEDNIEKSVRLFNEVINDSRS